MEGGKEGARADRRAAVTPRYPPEPCFQMVPADVESPEFCLGLQTLLSLKVRRMLALWGLTKGWDRETGNTGAGQVLMRKM